jgi:hypothetical protein
MSQLLLIANTGLGCGLDAQAEPLQTTTPLLQRWFQGVCHPCDHVKSPPLTAATHLRDA